MAKKQNTSSSSSTQKISSKTSKLIDYLEKFEKAGEEGLPLYAPKKARDRVEAFKYTPKGVPSTKDSLAKDLSEYIQKSRKVTISLLPQGKSKKMEEIAIQFYILSPSGKAFLAHQRDKILGLAKKKLEEKTQNIEGLRSALEEQSQEVGCLSQELKNLPQTLEILKKHFSQKISEMGERVCHAVEEMQNRFQQFFQQLEEVKKEFHAQVTSLEKTLPNQTVSALDQHFIKVQSQILHLENLNQLWSETLLKSPLLGENSSSVSSSAVSSFEQKEEKISALLLQITPKDRSISIEDLYQKLHHDGFSIGPGHLNDLIWKLAQENQIQLQAWPWTFGELKHREHAIFRPEVIYAHIKKI